MSATTFPSEQRVTVALDEDGWTTERGTVLDTWTEAGASQTRVALDNGEEVTVTSNLIDLLD